MPRQGCVEAGVMGIREEDRGRLKAWIYSENKDIFLDRKGDNPSESTLQTRCTLLFCD